MARHLVSVTVVINNRCLVPWAVIPIEARDSFCDILDSIKEGKYGTIPPGLLLDRFDYSLLISPTHVEPNSLTYTCQRVYNVLKFVSINAVMI